MKTKTAMITIAGRPNVGKSTLVNYLVGEKIAIVSNKPQTTRNRICGIVTRGNTQFVFVDTPGFHRARTKLGDYMVNVAQESIADVDLTILVVEPIASLGPQEEGLLQEIQADHCPVVLAINKIDTVEKEKLELARCVGATKLQTFIYVTFMNAMPQVFTGIKLGCINATIAALSADTVSGNIGMGYKIKQYIKYNNIDLAYGSIILVALIGLVTYNIVEAIEHKVVLWKN